MPMSMSSAVDEEAANALKLVIADRNRLFRECLASALGRDGHFDVVATFDRGEEAVGRLGARTADLLLVGMDCADRGILELIREVQERHPRVRVLVLGPGEVGRGVVDCFEAGARGYLVRDQSFSELRSALFGISNGDMVCPPRVAHLLFSRLAELGRQRRRCEKLEVLSLTPRELEILRLVADGLSNLQIAKQLFLSVHTVKNHVHKILETLGVHSRWEAVRHAVRKGWIPDRRRS